MNWTYLRSCAWVDTRARFIAGTPPGGTLLDLGSSESQTLGHMAESQAAGSRGIGSLRQLIPLFIFLPASHQKFTARARWLGWSAYLVARRPS